MRRCWSRWAAAWTWTEVPTSMALLRIAVGLIVAHNLGLLWWDDVGALFFDPEFGGISARNHRYPLLQGVPSSPGLLWSLVIAGEILSVGLIVGVGGRLTPLLLSQVCMAVFGIHAATGGGHDRLITNALWLLVLSPAHETMSLRCFRKTGRWVTTTAFPGWSRALGIFQLTLMYTMTGMAKQGSSWFASGDYRAIYHSLLLPSWQRFDMTVVAWAYPLTQIGTFVSWWWESTFVLVLLNIWLRSWDAVPRGLRWFARFDLRWPYMGIGVMVHGILFVTMNLGPFSEITLAFYVCLIRGEEWTSLASWLSRGRINEIRETPSSRPG